jgi:hypothetical protein
MSDESNKEIEDFFESPLSMADASHKLTYGLDAGRILKMQFMAATYHPLPEQ